MSNYTTAVLRASRAFHKLRHWFIKSRLQGPSCEDEKCFGLWSPNTYVTSSLVRRIVQEPYVKNTKLLIHIHSFYVYVVRYLFHENKTCPDFFGFITDTCKIWWLTSFNEDTQTYSEPVVSLILSDWSDHTAGLRLSQNITWKTQFHCICWRKTTFFGDMNVFRS